MTRPRVQKIADAPYKYANDIENRYRTVRDSSDCRICEPVTKPCPKTGPVRCWHGCCVVTTDERFAVCLPTASIYSRVDMGSVKTPLSGAGPKIGKMILLLSGSRQSIAGRRC